MAINQYIRRVVEYNVRPAPGSQNAMKNLRTETALAGNAVKNVSRNSRNAALATRNLGYVAQNASYQIADFFVMLQGGVGVGRALSTQLPQLLAGFGSLGAVLGAAAAIGATLVVTLSNTEKITKDLSGAVEDYEYAWENVNDAITEYLKKGDVGSLNVLQTAQSAERIAAANLREALKPPDPSAWGGFVEVLKSIWKYIKDISLAATSLDEIITLVRAALKIYVEPFFIEIDKGANVAGDSLAELAINLASSADNFDQLNNNASALALSLAQFTDNPALDTFNIPETQLQAYTQATDLLKKSFEALYGIDPKKWPEEATAAYDILDKKFQEVRARTKLLTDDIKRITAIDPETKNYGQLKRLSELEEKTLGWRAALKELYITGKEADDVIEALTYIERRKPVQDIIIDIGDKVEDHIVTAMKAGKFAVKDFVEFAIEQFARLALSRALEPFFLLLANTIPGAIGGSPSPNTGGGTTGPLLRGMDLAPMTMAVDSPQAEVSQMYTIGKNFSYIPGTKAGGNDNYNNVTVNVNNYGKSEVDVQQRETSRGVEIDVLIKDTVRSGFANGEFDSVMSASYGARRVAF